MKLKVLSAFLCFLFSYPFSSLAHYYLIAYLPSVVFLLFLLISSQVLKDRASINLVLDSFLIREIDREKPLNVMNHVARHPGIYAPPSLFFNARFFFNYLLV